MKVSRKAIASKAHARPTIRFETQQLTGFAGIVILQELFAELRLTDRLRNVFHRRQQGKVYRPQKLFLQLMLHLLLGFRSLGDVRCYQTDPLVKRVLGLTRIADPATLSRMLKDCSESEVQGLQRLLSSQVLDRLQALGLSRLTLDFDGSICTTKRRAEGTAVGFNKQKKGSRSYYPLFCTVAQTGQVFKMLHRPGNVHDSKGAIAFILECVHEVRLQCPQAIVEVRMDSAFFSDEIVTALDQAGVEFTLSVPFQRFPKLKERIEDRHRWYRCGRGKDFFELQWKPDCWPRRYRFLVIRQEVAQQRKGELQLDLFEPRDWKYEYKVIITNKSLKARAATNYHEGRGAQEGIFGELKSDVAMGHIPVRTRNGNQVYLLAGLLSHNLVRELQMRERAPVRRTNLTRAPLWVFERVSTLRQQILQRPGRLTRPCGAFTLTINLSVSLRKGFQTLYDAAAGKLAA
jgi:hypothetical protein